MRLLWIGSKASALMHSKSKVGPCRLFQEVLFPIDRPAVSVFIKSVSLRVFLQQMHGDSYYGFAHGPFGKVAVAQNALYQL